MTNELTTMHMLEALETANKKLTKWEEDFIESITEQYKTRGFMTDRQAEILKRIYDEKK